MKQSLHKLRIADLELFITAAHLRNLGQAALLHHLSQSAASTAIQRVESAFGQILCTHERRQFSLTHEGKNFLPRAEIWLKNLKESVSPNVEQPIRLVTTHAIARVAIPAILPIANIDLKLMRPDIAHGAILKDEADLALVLDNAPWKGVMAAEIGKGKFQLFSTQKDISEAPVLLPEDQMEVLSLQERWTHLHSSPIPIKARLPSWSLIADICQASKEIGFLPDFLAQITPLYPVSWQPPPSSYRILALYRKSPDLFQQRIHQLIDHLRSIFAY